MTVQIRVDPEHDRSLERALQSLRADQRTLDQWGAHSVELALAIDDLEELRDRIITAKADKALEASGRLIGLLRTGKVARPW